MCQYQDLVVLSFTFATGTPHVRDVRAIETDNGRLSGPGYPLYFHGMSKGRLNQFTLVHSVRKNAQTLAAVTVVRKEDAVEQSQIFFKRVQKAVARLKTKAERIAKMKAEGNELRAMVLDPATGAYTERDFLEVKKGDQFHVKLADGTRTERYDRLALSNGFWSQGYIAAILADPVPPQMAAEA